MGNEAQQLNITAAVRAIDADLPRLARQTISSHLDLTDPLNRKFFDEPDGREQHQVHWHQWGIITHTRVFLAALDVDVPKLLRTWDLWHPICERLDRHVDGVTCWNLLHVAVLLHDIGKFAARTHSATGFHFPNHERISGEIVRDEIDLNRYGFTVAQREYIARNAADHFVLGLVRKRAREKGNYGSAYVNSDEFVTLSREIRTSHPGDFLEIGVLFLGDSLAKIDRAHGPDRALSQHETNLAVARRYLELAVVTPFI